MGLFDDYGIDPDEVPDAPSYEIADGEYDFEISEAGIWVKEKEDGTESQSFYIDYLCGDEGKKKREFFNLPEDPSAPTEGEVQKLGYLKQRILSLGFDRSQVKDVEGDDLVGITGTLELKTTVGRKGKFQNVRNVLVSVEEPEAPAAPARTAVKAKAPARAGRAAANVATKPNPFAKAARGE